MNARVENPILTLPELIRLLDEFLPLRNKDDAEQYGDLLEDLFHFSLNTRGELLRILKTHRHLVLRYEGEMAAHRKTHSLQGNPVAMETFENKLRLARGVYFTHTGLIRLILHAELGNLWDKYTSSPEWRERERKSLTKFFKPMCHLYRSPAITRFTQACNSGFNITGFQPCNLNRYPFE